MFCGTRYNYSWLGLSLAIRNCTDVVIKIVENRDDELPRKVKYMRSKQEPPVEDQKLLFPVDMAARERLGEMVQVVEYYLPKNNHRAVKSPQADYAGYELFEFVRRWPDEEWEPQLAKMQRIAGGEIPEVEECLNLIEFLDKIERSAMARWHHESRGGGCF